MRQGEREQADVTAVPPPDPVIAADCELLAHEVEVMMLDGSYTPEARAEAIVEALLAYGYKVGDA